MCRHKWINNISIYCVILRVLYHTIKAYSHWRLSRLGLWLQKAIPWNKTLNRLGNNNTITTRLRMRTTIDISDDLMKKAKIHAIKEGITKRAIHQATWKRSRIGFRKSSEGPHHKRNDGKTPYWRQRFGSRNWRHDPNNVEAIRRIDWTGLTWSTF